MWSKTGKTCNCEKPMGINAKRVQGMVGWPVKAANDKIIGRLSHAL